MLFDDDGNENANKITHQSQEICENFSKMLSSGESADSVDDYTNCVPYDSWNALELVSEGLEVNAGGVGRWDQVGDETKCDDDRAERAKASKRSESFHNERTLRDGVG